MAGDAFLGVDIGTSGVKALVLASSGDVIASHTVPLALDTPRPGWAEQHPEDWWSAAMSAIREVVGRTGTKATVAAVGLTGQMHSSVFLDREGAVVRPAMLWCDGRTTRECAELTAEVGEASLSEWTCNPALEGFTLPKVLWLRREEPAAFARVATVLLPKDYIRWRLTGALATEPSDASGTLMYDPRRGCWSRPLLERVGLSERLLPEVGGSSEVLGQVTPSAAAALGLRPGTPVVGGGADNACGAVGVGAVAPGEVVVSWGTSGTVLAPTGRPVVDPGLRAHTFCHVAPERWYVMGVVLSAGAAFAWFRDRFAADLDGAPDADRRLDAEAMAVPPGAEGVTFLPYLQGERTPHRDAAARGAFVGLSLAHTRGHLARAVVEGIAFALRDCVGILGELGLPMTRVLLTGGGGRSAFLRQLQADVYGMPVTAPSREEGPAFGAALLAAVGAGAFPNLEAACREMTRSGEVLTPAHAAHSAYEEPYRRFRSTYQGPSAIP